MQHAAPPLRFATARLATGPQLHHAEQGDPGGEAIVFLPAYADSWFSYSRVLALLPARYHAYALDQRGHGDSERPACCYTVEDFAADAVAFLDAAGVVRDFQAGAAHVPLPGTFREGLVAESRKLPARVWRDAADGLVAFDDTADLGRIAAPTLLVWGDRDGLLPAEEQRRLAAAIPGARSRVYPETGHSPHWERPERFVADLDAFMREG
jgi:pimeloyl-ACP methyl ester carboxylesterase